MRLAIVAFLALAGARVLADDTPRGQSSGAATPPDSSWERAPSRVRMEKSRNVKSARPPASSSDEPTTGEFAGLRALSLREGAARISFGGATLTLKPGDGLGSTRVKAIGSDRLVLERAGTPAAPGATTVVVTFGADGRPRVRSYAEVVEEPPSASEAR
jgi:hypothetical protein